MPWWLTAIVFFFSGMAVDRFVVERRYIRRMETNLKTLRAMNDRLEEQFPIDPPED